FLTRVGNQDQPCLGSLGRGPIEALPHFLAGLEERRQLLGDRNLVAGARIAAGAGLALLGREGAEAAQLDALAPGERVGDLAENGVDDSLDVTLIEIRIARGHALHEFRLDHRSSPLETIPAFCRSSCPEWRSASIANPQCFCSGDPLRRRSRSARTLNLVLARAAKPRQIRRDDRLGGLRLDAE